MSLRTSRANWTCLRRDLLKSLKLSHEQLRPLSILCRTPSLMKAFRRSIVVSELGRVPYLLQDYRNSIETIQLIKLSQLPSKHRCFSTRCCISELSLGPLKTSSKFWRNKLLPLATLSSSSSRLILKSKNSLTIQPILKFTRKFKIWRSKYLKKQEERWKRLAASISNLSKMKKLIRSKWAPFQRQIQCLIEKTAKLI